MKTFHAGRQIVRMRARCRPGPTPRPRPPLPAGAYTHYDTLPHYPTTRNQWAQGFTTCRWQGGRLQPLSVTSCHNPAFMK